MKSCAKASIHPPAIAAPLTIANVGKGRTEILPSNAINYNTNQPWDYCGRFVAYFRSRPPLNNLESDTVTIAVGSSHFYI